MMAGITMVVAGFGVFWYLQAWKQGRNALEDPHGKIPSCTFSKSRQNISEAEIFPLGHHRLAQEEQKSFPRMPGERMISTPMANILPNESLPRPNDGKDLKPGTVANMFERVHVSRVS